ncbi:tlde1 domain-containing protein [Actinokineospora cianjurensis]|uniref:tlde1 domain-containing protein n=1 Tax=Actinokineospora cianjurensis TaxID=585224 RepID=UPI001B87A15F|nr:tlde1 domain-containing protein [Actinokineospora cianjurensis]
MRHCQGGHERAVVERGPTRQVPVRGLRGAGNAAVAGLLGQVRVQRQTAPVTAGGPAIRAGNGTTAELVAERARLLRERDAHAKDMAQFAAYQRGIERLDLLLAERGNSGLADAAVEMVFDGATLTLGTQSWVAVSGHPDAAGAFDYSPARQRLEGVGPIPAGVYWVDPSQMVDLSSRWFYASRYEGPWGTHRITVHPFDTTHTFGRGGFFIHGGSTPGSAGCVDLTSSASAFARALSTVPLNTKVKLTVRYP